MSIQTPLPWSVPRQTTEEGGWFLRDQKDALFKENILLMNPEYVDSISYYDDSDPDSDFKYDFGVLSDRKKLNKYNILLRKIIREEIVLISSKNLNPNDKFLRANCDWIIFMKNQNTD